jgi:RecA-family ATPase
MIVASSALLLDLVARLTTGWPLPGEPHDVRRQPVNVLIISAEDNVGQVIRPRLRIAGADLGPVVFLVRPFDHLGRIAPLSIPEDLDDVQRIIVEHRIRLVVIDPIAAYWSESVRTNNDASVRKAMTPLKVVAESTGAAIVIVRHLNKSGEAKAIYRGGGSIAITAAERSTLLASPHPDNEGKRVLARIKNNLAPPSDAWVYRADAVEDPLNPGRTQPRITWLRTERLSADDVLKSDDARRHAPALRDAATDLRQVLANGPMTVADVKKATDAGGHSWRTVTRAAERFGVVKRPIRREGGFGVEALGVGATEHIRLRRTDSTRGRHRSIECHRRP